MEKRSLVRFWGRSFGLVLGVTLGLLVLLPAGVARAQLRNWDLTFKAPSDARVVGFHVYLSGMSMSYADYRDDINFIPAADATGVSHYSLTGLDQFDDVYISLKSYDASGAESAFSNQLMLAAEAPPQQCLVSGCDDKNPCTVDTCGATGCTFDPAPNRGMTCDDGNARTINDKCQTNGSCSGTVAQCVVNSDCPAPADACAGPQVCVANKCQAGTSPKPNETTCNDGNSSTKYDVCRSGVCRGFACGTDAQCSDNQGCNGVERCVNNACMAGTPMVCGDGNVCNGTETCSNGVCMSGMSLSCPTDDGPCFDAFCDPVMGCRVQTHPDGSSCTTQASAQPGMCSMGVCVATPTTPPPDPNTPTDPNTVGGRDPRPPQTPNTTCNTSFAPPTDVHQELSADSETDRKIVWSSSFHPMGALLQYRSASGTWKGLLAVPENHNGCDAVYTVTLSNLKPGAGYVYRVSGSSPQGRVWSDVFALTAGPVPDRGKFKFAFFGGNGLQGSAQSTQAGRVLGQIQRGHYPIVLGGGGYALSTEAIAAGAATSAAQAVELWKAQASVVTGNSIFAPVLGDTEVDSSANGERAADYAEYMQMAGTAQAPYGSYSYDFGGTHFLAVNAPTIGSIHPSIAAGAAHLAWIDADLAAAKAAGARWIVVYMHSDLFSSEKSDASVATVRTALGNILVKYGVNAVLSGEGNSYERTRALRGNLATPTLGPAATMDVTTATDGVVFVRAGAGGRTAFGSWLSPMQPTWSAVRDNTHAVFLRVSVSDAKLIVTAYGLDAKGKQSVLDSVTMR